MIRVPQPSVLCASKVLAAYSAKNLLPGENCGTKCAFYLLRGGIPIHAAYQSKEATGLSPSPNADCRNATRIGRNLYYKTDHYAQFGDWTGSVFPGHGIRTGLAYRHLLWSARFKRVEDGAWCGACTGPSIEEAHFPVLHHCNTTGNSQNKTVRGSSMAPTVSLSTAIIGVA